MTRVGNLQHACHTWQIILTTVFVSLV